MPKPKIKGNYPTKFAVHPGIQTTAFFREVEHYHLYTKTKPYTKFILVELFLIQDLEKDYRLVTFEVESLNAYFIFLAVPENSPFYGKPREKLMLDIKHTRINQFGCPDIIGQADIFKNHPLLKDYWYIGSYAIGEMALEEITNILIEFKKSAIKIQNILRLTDA